MGHKVIHQLTPYSCVLSCLADYLSELGTFVTQGDLLLHQRDVCAMGLQQPEHYGSVNPANIPVLFQRYLIQLNPFVAQDEASLKVELGLDGVALFASCASFNGTANHGHYVRIRDVDAGNIVIASPGFTHGSIMTPTIVDFFANWTPTVYRASLM